MVKVKKFQPEVAKEFLEFDQKVKDAQAKSEEELRELLKNLKPKIYKECLKNVNKAFAKNDGEMKLYDFLSANKNNKKATESIEPGARIIVNSKPPRTPRVAEPVFSADGTPLRL